MNNNDLYTGNSNQIHNDYKTARKMETNSVLYCPDCADRFYEDCELDESWRLVYGIMKLDQPLIGIMITTAGEEQKVNIYPFELPCECQDCRVRLPKGAKCATFTRYRSGRMPELGLWENHLDIERKRTFEIILT